MLPLEQLDYKQQWLPKAYICQIHSDMCMQAKRWLRRNLKPHQWHILHWTNIYEHQVLFEHLEHLELFKQDIL